MCISSWKCWSVTIEGHIHPSQVWHRPSEILLILDVFATEKLVFVNHSDKVVYKINRQTFYGWIIMKLLIPASVALCQVSAWVRTIFWCTTRKVLICLIFTANDIKNVGRVTPASMSKDMGIQINMLVKAIAEHGRYESLFLLPMVSYIDDSLDDLANYLKDKFQVCTHCVFLLQFYFA